MIRVKNFPPMRIGPDRLGLVEPDLVFVFFKVGFVLFWVPFKGVFHNLIVCYCIYKMQRYFLESDDNLNARESW